MRFRRRKRWVTTDCMICGGQVKQAKGYILVAASNYSPLLPVKMRSLPYRYAHKGCWP